MRLSTRLTAAMVALVALTATAVELLTYGNVETQSRLLAGLLAVLFAAILAAIIARSLTKSLVQMTAAVEGFSRHEQLTAPIHASGEIGVRGFVQKITDNSQDKAIVRSIIVMAHNLGLAVIAEGVETAAQAETLRIEGCEEVQGFLYAKPLPATQFEGFLRASQIVSAEASAKPATSSARDYKKQA